MTDMSKETQAMMAVMETALGFVTEAIGAVILACEKRDAIDSDMLRDALENLASRPDVGRMERALSERLLRTIS